MDRKNYTTFTVGSCNCNKEKPIIWRSFPSEEDAFDWLIKRGAQPIRLFEDDVEHEDDYFYDYFEMDETYFQSMVEPYSLLKQEVCTFKKCVRFYIVPNDGDLCQVAEQLAKHNL